VSGGDVLDHVESLIAKSLLRQQTDPTGEPRLTMLETIREYGLERLAEFGTLEAIRRWHAEHFLALAEEAEPLLRGPEQGAWLDRLEAEHDNFRATLEWSLSSAGNPETALRLSGALVWFWQTRSYATEGRRWLMAALEGRAGSPAARMKALYGAGWLAHLQRDSAVAQPLLEESLALTRELGDNWTAAWVLYLLGRVAYFEGDSGTARARGEACLAMAQELGDRWLVAFGLHILGLAAHIEADYPAARSFYERSLAIRLELGFQEGIGIMLQLLGMIAYREGDYATARALCHEGLGLLWKLGARWIVGNSISAFASLAATQRQPERAVRLAGATAILSETISVLPIPLAQGMLEETLEVARRTLGEEAYARAWAEGRALSLEGAIAEARAVEVWPPPGAPDGHGPAPKFDGYPAGLTPREVEVLRLVAAGRTTREIADELVVSVPTVERHITHIYGKIGVRGRAEATAYALKQGLA
jgi:DNA-binding CsgD family transcriptional regulator/tetratricopeptide (TPR) repeat protein